MHVLHHRSYVSWCWNYLTSKAHSNFAASIVEIVIQEVVVVRIDKQTILIFLWLLWTVSPKVIGKIKISPIRILDYVATVVKFSQPNPKVKLFSRFLVPHFADKKIQIFNIVSLEDEIGEQASFQISTHSIGPIKISSCSMPCIIFCYMCFDHSGWTIFTSTVKNFRAFSLFADDVMARIIDI